MYCNFCLCMQNTLSDFVDSLSGERLSEFAADAPQEKRENISEGLSINQSNIKQSVSHSINQASSLLIYLSISRSIGTFSRVGSVVRRFTCPHFHAIPKVKVRARITDRFRVRGGLRSGLGSG